MHPAAFHWAKTHIPELPKSVIDIGGADINCSLRNMYTWSRYRCVDIADGPGVDIVAPFQDWALLEPEKSVDLVVSFEVFEHTAAWPDMVVQAARLLEDGGLFIGTCAGTRRGPHSAWGDPLPRPDEHYANLESWELCATLGTYFNRYTVDLARDQQDLRWVAYR